MVPTNLVHIVVGPGRGTWDRTNQKIRRPLVGVYPRTSLGIGFTLSPYPLSLLRPFPAGCWKMCKTYGKTHIIGKNKYYSRVLRPPRLHTVVQPVLSLVFYSTFQIQVKIID